MSDQVSEQVSEKIPRFGMEHKEYVLEALAAGLPPPQVAEDFIEVFPDLIGDVEFKEARGIIIIRIENAVARYPEKIEAIRRAHEDEDLGWDKVPIARAGYRLRLLMRLLHEIPVKTLQRMGEDTRGRPYKVYKYLVSERLKVLAEARQEVSFMSKSGDFVDADGKIKTGDGSFGDVSQTGRLGIENGGAGQAVGGEADVD